MKQLPARLIKPSTAEGDVLTTVSGKTAWVAPSGGSGAPAGELLIQDGVTPPAPLETESRDDYLYQG